MAHQIVSGEMRQPYGVNSYYTPAEWAMAAQEYIDNGYDDDAADLIHMVQAEDDAEREIDRISYLHDSIRDKAWEAMCNGYPGYGA